MIAVALSLKTERVPDYHGPRRRQVSVERVRDHAPVEDDTCMWVVSLCVGVYVVGSLQR